MKKFTAIFLALVIAMSFSITAFAEETTEVYFNKYSSEDGKIIIDVELSEKGELCMLQFCVAYDDDVLNCLSAECGNAFSGSTAPTINKTEGKIYFVWDALSPLTGGGTVLRLEFTAKEDNKNTSVRIDENEEFLAVNENFEEIGSIRGPIEFVTGGTSSGNNNFESNTSEEGTSENENPKEPSLNDSSKEDNPGKEDKPEENSVPDNTPEEGYVNGIKIDKTKLSIEIGKEAKLKVSGTDKELFWFSSDENVVKVVDGKIIPVAPGKATVTVMTEDGLEEAACVVTVTGEVPSEEGEHVLDVVSPRHEKETGTDAWVWILIAALGIAAVAAVIFIKSKASKK